MCSTVFLAFGGLYISFDSNGEIGSLKVRRNSLFQITHEVSNWLGYAIVANRISLLGGVPCDGKGAKQNDVSCARAASHYLRSGAKTMPTGPKSRIFAYDDLDVSRALAV